MLLLIIAGVLAIIGFLLFFVDYLSDVAGTKNWAMALIIASGAICALKYYLDNPEPVNNFFKSVFSAR
jgi:hypothetical protein